MMLLCAMALSARADGITSLKLTISHNGGPAFTQEFHASGWEELVLSEQTTSLIISKVEVQTSGSMQAVLFQGTMYNTSQGGPSGSDEWRTMPMNKEYDGYWVLDWGNGRELIKSEWLMENTTRTLEFFVDGGDMEDGKYQYANGVADSGYNNNYKVTFTTSINPDAIDLVPADKANGAIHNLSGQRVGKDYRGLVIKGGKKVLVR